MGGEFYTERDIEDLIRAGKSTLQLSEGDRLTDLARERASKGGLVLLGPSEASSQVARQAASVRYAVDSGPSKSTAKNASQRAPLPGELHQRIKQSVSSKLDSSVDPAMLDQIISRVLDQMGLS